MISTYTNTPNDVLVTLLSALMTMASPALSLVCRPRAVLTEPGHNLCRRGNTLLSVFDASMNDELYLTSTRLHVKVYVHVLRLLLTNAPAHSLAKS